MPLSDSSETCIRAARPQPSPVGLQTCAGIPEVSRFPCRKCLGCLGSTTTQDRPGTRATARGRVAFRSVRQRRRPDCTFSKLHTQPTYSPVYASLCTSRCPTQNSGPSGSLLLSREDLSSSAFRRFIPALPDLRFCEGPRLAREFEIRGRCPRLPDVSPSGIVQP